MQKINNVFILGVNGFPYGSARVEKLKLIGKSLAYNQLKVEFICNAWGYSKKGEIPPKGRFEGIDYIYTSGTTHRPASFIVRRWIKFKGMIKEMKYLSKNKCDAAIVSVMSGMFFPLFYYWMFARMNGYKLYYPHHEEPEVTLNRNSLYHRVNLFLFNLFAWKMLDGAFPISNYLAEKIKKKEPRLPLLKVPAIVDFDIFNNLKEASGLNLIKYFMYCGSIVYYEVVEFVIEAFELVPDDEFELHLVISGSRAKKEKLHQRIELSNKKQKIQVFENLDYDVLVKKYINAKALLIPLRDTIQDKARLPHKIGEYTASGNVVISNYIGDIPFYFQHTENALIADHYDIHEYAGMMEFVIQYPREAKEIGKAGYETGMKVFNYKTYGEQIKNFMQNN
jgi:glycosyltransferase involved in cell wall biosynthesis